MTKAKKTKTPKRIDAYADSTIAMSAYNVLAMTGGSTVEELHRAIEAAANPRLEIEQTRRAVKELVDRGLAVAAPTNNSKRGARVTYQLVDALRHQVKRRDRSDMAENPRTGRVDGGWGRWMAEDAHGALVPVEEVIR